MTSKKLRLLAETFHAPLPHGCEALGKTCLFPGLPKKSSRYSPTLDSCRGYQPAVLFNSKLLGGISYPAGSSPSFAPSFGVWQPTWKQTVTRERYRKWMKSWVASPLPNSKMESEKERASPLGVHIGVFQYKSFTFDGCRFDLFSTLSKLLHPYASFKTQKHQFAFFLCLSLSVSTSWKSNSSLFIKSTISLWTERQGKPFPE